MRLRTPKRRSRVIAAITAHDPGLFNGFGRAPGHNGPGRRPTQSKAKTVPKYFAELSEPRKSEVKKIHAVIRKAVPKLKPFMIYGMVGYGKFHYKYAGGREGDWCVIGLASQKNHISVYVCATRNGKYLPESNRKKLGKVSVGKSCIRFKKAEDLDLKVLSRLCREAATLKPKM